MKTAFDYTALSSYLRCQRYYNYRINRHLVPPVPPTAPAFGGSMHKALDCWYETKDPKEAVKTFNKEYSQIPEDVWQKDGKRTPAMAEWIIHNYHKQYENQPVKVVHTEMTFEVPFPDGDGHYIGRIDKIINFDGSLWIMDHKTTSQLGPQFFKMHTPNLQFSGYTWAARKLGHNVQGVLVDAILVAKGLLPGPSKSRSLTPLARDFSYRDEDDLQEFESIATEVRDAIKRSESHDHWLPNFDACTYYGECPFRRVCKEPRQIREKIIKADFVTDEWDPRHGNETVKGVRT